MRPDLLVAVPLLAFGLACGGVGAPKHEEPPPAPAGASTTAPASDASPTRIGPTDPKAAAKALAAAGYTANVYGVCRKYADCKCTLYDSVQDCVDQFGKASTVFPQQVWTCVLARDCDGLCNFDAGTCFKLYAEQLEEGTKKPRDADKCAAGTLPVEVYDLHGDYLRTDCRE